MVDLSHIQMQFDELEASMTPEERAERDRRHKQTLAELAKQQERMMAPYLEMERMLAPYRAVQEALAQVELAEKIRWLAEPSALETAFAEMAREDELRQSIARAFEPSPAELVFAELSRTDQLAQLASAAPLDSALAEFGRSEELERSLGLSARDMLVESAERAMFADLEAMRLHQQLYCDALAPQSFVEESLLRLAEPSPFESILADTLRFEESLHREFHSTPQPAPHSWVDEGAEEETEDSDAVHVEEEPEEAPASSARSRPSLKERRMIAYDVLREDVRLSAVEGGPEFDEMLWRMHVLLMAIERDVEEDRY